MSKQKLKSVGVRWREGGREGGVAYHAHTHTHTHTHAYLGSRGDLDTTLALLSHFCTRLKSASIPARELARAGADLLYLGL